jgi:hypothetical protein
MLNEAAKSLLGFGESDIANVPRLWPGQVHTEDLHRYAEFASQIAKTKNPGTCDYRFYPKDADQPVWLRETSAGVKGDQPQRPWAILSTYVEISDLKRSPSRDTPQIKMDDILDGLFHDVQNSIHRVAMGLDLANMGLGHETDAAKTGEVLGLLENSVRDLRGYVDPMTGSRPACDPAAVLDSVFANRQTGKRRRSLDISWVRPQSLPAVPVHKALLARALERILDFCESLAQEGDKLYIEARPLQSSGQYCAEIKLKLFSDAPWRIDTGDNFSIEPTDHGQAGEGMKLALEILRRHRGEVSFQRASDDQCNITIRMHAAPK